VWVHLGRLFATAPETRRLRDPAADSAVAGEAARVTGEVWVLDGEVPGMLLEWNRASWGLWVGLVAYELAHADGRHDREQVPPQLVPEYVLRPRSRPAPHHRLYPPPSRTHLAHVTDPRRAG
jgi:hypothetical protein